MYNLKPLHHFGMKGTTFATIVAPMDNKPQPGTKKLNKTKLSTSYVSVEGTVYATAQLLAKTVDHLLLIQLRKTIRCTSTNICLKMCTKCTKTPNE